MHIKAALKAAFGFPFFNIELYLLYYDTILKYEMEEEISEPRKHPFLKKMALKARTKAHLIKRSKYGKLPET